MSDMSVKVVFSVCMFCPISYTYADKTQFLFWRIECLIEVYVNNVEYVFCTLCRSSVSEQQLLTQSMRQAQQEEKMSKYSRVAIRVVFPEKLIVQGLFRPRETG